MFCYNEPARSDVILPDVHLCGTIEAQHVRLVSGFMRNNATFQNKI